MSKRLSRIELEALVAGLIAEKEVLEQRYRSVRSRLEQSQAEVTRLREGWMKAECKSMCFDTFAGYWYRPGDCQRKCTAGDYCQAVIDRVGGHQ